MLYYLVELYVVIGVILVFLFYCSIYNSGNSPMVASSLLIITAILSIESERNELLREGMLLTCFVSGICLWYLSIQEREFEFGMLIILICIGLLAVLNSKDLISMYVSLELQSLGLYIIGSYRKDSSYATESGLKYYIMGGFSSGVMLLGCSLVYGETGTVDLESISQLSVLGINNTFKFGISLIVVGLLFKLGAAPFHMWIIDVIEGVSMRSSRIFSVVPKLGVLIMLIKVIEILPRSAYENGLVMVSGVSIIVSVCGALYQRKVKRFLAYSGVGHIGYMLIAVCAGDEQSAIMYMLIYMFTTYVIWSVIENNRIVYIEELQKVSRRNSYTGMLMCVLLLSVAGIPPLGGFFVKLNVLMSGIDNGLYGLTTVALVCTVIGGFNYVRWLKIMYSEKVINICSKDKQEESILKTLVMIGVCTLGFA